MTDADIILVVFLSVMVGVVVIAIYPVHTETGDNIAEKIVTISDKYTEMRWGSTTYHFIDTDKNSYHLYGDNQGARFQLLERNQTYRIAANKGVSCSEERIRNHNSSCKY